MQVSSLWPKSILPGARKRVANLIRQMRRLRARIQNRAVFPLWRAYSRSVYGPMRQVNAHGYKLWVRTDDLRSYWIWRDAGTQHDVMTVWRQLINLNPSLAIDVGANYGEFSVPAAARVPLLAIEANPVISELLRRSLQSYERARVVTTAVSDRPGESVFYIPSGYTGGASLSACVVGSIGSSHVRKGNLVQEVGMQVTTIDALVGETTPDSVILKIDVEGFDREAFEGALHTLRKARWWRAIIEFNAETLMQRGESVEKTWAYFSKYPGVVLWGQRKSSGISLKKLSNQLPAEPLPRANLLIGLGEAEGLSP